MSMILHECLASWELSTYSVQDLVMLQWTIVVLVSDPGSDLGSDLCGR